MNKKMLESAVAMPRAMFGGVYLHKDLSEMAAAYAFHLGKNHPFVDGNKRTAAQACNVFLLMNGYLMDVDNDKSAETIVNVVSGKMEKDQLADFIRLSLTLAILE